MRHENLPSAVFGLKAKPKITLGIGKKEGA
jgi:hypothetical protein